AAADLDHEVAAVPADADRCCGLAALPRLVYGGADLLAVRADMARGAIHHDLRSIGAGAETLTVAGLARGRGPERGGGAPAEPIPIGHMKRQRQHVAAVADHLIQIRIRRRTG